MVHAGPLKLAPAEAHHVRDVLRLAQGAVVEVFDAIGRSARATIARCTPREVVLEVQGIREPGQGPQWTIASALPKGSRVDWMIEKLSELGTAAFIPLRSQRSVVLPEGQGKRQRWQRLAVEAAKQSRRTGVMRIEELTGVDELVNQAGGTPATWYLSTAPGAGGVLELISNVRQRESGEPLRFLIGPEGGWTDAERAAFDAAGFNALSLGPTVLRIETAAVAAAVLGCAVAAQALAP
jgi:16S rRNA (uracil1498-N3)-methyltransferase